MEWVWNMLTQIRMVDVVKTWPCLLIKMPWSIEVRPLGCGTKRALTQDMTTAIQASAMGLVTSLKLSGRVQQSLDAATTKDGLHADIAMKQVT